MRHWVKAGLVLGFLGCSQSLFPDNSGRSADRIDIEPSVKGGNGFAPPELNVWAGDQISWRNRTGLDHQPGVINDDGRFVAFHAQTLRAGSVSPVFSPMPRIADNPKTARKDTPQIPFTLHYVCGLHPQEKGTIHVIPTP